MERAIVGTFEKVANRFAGEYVLGAHQMTGLRTVAETVGNTQDASTHHISASGAKIGGRNNHQPQSTLRG